MTIGEPATRQKRNAYIDRLHFTIFEEKLASSHQSIQKIDYTQWFNESFHTGLVQILKFSITNPAMAFFLLKTIIRFYFASRRRQKWAQRGIQVPPMLIYSITSECNLDCDGCYAKLLHTPKGEELNAQEFEDVIRQADDIGVSYILVAGGEPFTRGNLLEATAAHTNIIFTPFTNGLLLNDEHIRRLKQQRHVLPIVSWEGYEPETDHRRGLGVYDNNLRLIQRFNHEGIYFGVSITTTRGNIDLVTSPSFIRTLAEQGCKVFFFINYIPAAEGTDDMVMTRAQVDELNRVMAAYRHQYPALFLAFPGSEIHFGGCLAAGKGFVHINSAGDVQPCPFSPSSDAHLKNMPLIEALKSPLLAAIRKNSDRLDESNGICALWNNQDWVAELIENSVE